MAVQGGLAGGLADPSRVCKRVTVVLCAIAHVAVTLYVLRALVGHSSSSSSSSSQHNRATSSSSSSSPPSSSSYANSADCLRTWGISNSYGKQVENVKKLQEVKRREANEFRRQSAPHELIRRVKEIEAEVAIDSPNKVRMPCT